MLAAGPDYIDADIFIFMIHIMFCLFVVGYLEGSLCGLVLHGSSAL